MTPPYGMIDALTGVIGESDTEIGGLHMTRLTDVVAVSIALATTLTWDGTLTVITADTSELAEGDWVWLDSDAQWFQIETLVVDTSLTLLNPYSKTIPTDSGPSSKAQISFPVETTVDWLAAGRVGIDGVVYHYTSKTNTSFDGITYLKNGEITPGALKQHRIESTVLDLNKLRTALDFVRRAMLVDYAEGDDLNALGRNLGVYRLPFISGDDRFREIIKALAYNPKGTLLGLELALDGLVGKGNYRIYEDLNRYPCTVFIQLLGSAASDASSVGKAYLTGVTEVNCLNESAIPLPFLLTTRGAVHAIRFKPEEFLTDCRTALPSADQIREYTGAGLTPVWAYQGTAGGEGTAIRLYTGDPSGGTEFFAPIAEARYRRGLRVTAEAVIRLDFVLMIPVGATEATSNFGFTIIDGLRGMTVAANLLNTNTFVLGCAPQLSGPFTLNSPGVTLPRGVWHTITLEKNERSDWRLYVNGLQRQYFPYNTPYDAAAGGLRRAVFGISGSPATFGTSKVAKQVSVWANDITDFAAAIGNTGVIAAPDQLTVTGYTPQTDDIGKTILLSGLTAVTPGGGRNNGHWEILTRSGSLLTLGAPAETDAILPGGAAPTRIIVPATSRQFRYPDDLGRAITISGSTLGNNGTWTIVRLLDPDTFVDFGSWANHEDAVTNACEVSGASFVPETGLAWQIDTNFTAESNVVWQIPTSIDVTGGNSIALRMAMPSMDAGALKVLAITYSDVLSAGVLIGAAAVNAIIQEYPEVWWRYYPFYLADPLGFVKTYLKEITAAGVIPDFQIV